MVRRRVVCAAIRFPDGLVVCGPRHFHAIHFAHERLKDRAPVQYSDVEQGFVDQHNNFLSREEAWVIAQEAQQIIRRVGGDEQGRLFSENIY